MKSDISSARAISPSISSTLNVIFRSLCLQCPVPTERSFLLF
nr:MAG TPA: hypothetical protein [Caudoviricetes sp.]